MEHRIKLNSQLAALVSDFEERTANGDYKYLNDKTFHQLLEFYEKDGQIDKAINVAELAINQFSYRSSFIIIKARLLLYVGDLDEAFLLLEKAESIAPFENEIKILRAKALTMAREHTEAMKLLEDLKDSAVETDLVDILVCESYIHEHLKDHDAMYDCLLEALHINRAHEEAGIRFWTAVELSRRYEAAKEIYSDIINDEPYNSLAWYHLGHAYAATGSYEDAIDAIEYSFIIAPEFESGYMDCAELCFQLKYYDRALYFYKEANKLFGPESDILIHIAECEVKLGRVDDAKLNLFEALKIDPYNDELFYHLAECYAHQGFWYKAINAYHKSIDIEDRCEDYYFGLAKAYSAIENSEKALYFYRKAALTGLEQSCYWESYISALIKLGDYDKALKVLQEADQFTFGADLMYCESAIHIIKNDKSKGMRILEEALIENFDIHRLLFEIQPELELDPEIGAMIQYYKQELA